MVVGCARCGSRRVAEEGRKSAACPRCGATIDLRHTPPLYTGERLEDAQLFMGEEASGGKGGANRADLTSASKPSGKGERARERGRIAEAVGNATGRANQLKLVLRRGFEAFGELTVEDLDAIARQAEIEGTGAELADEIVELGLAGRTKAGALVPLREGR